MSALSVARAAVTYSLPGPAANDPDAMVIAAATFRGGRLVRGDLPPTVTIRPGGQLDGAQKLRLGLEGASDQHLIAELCERQGISEVEYYEWREAARAGAVHALDRAPAPAIS